MSAKAGAPPLGGFLETDRAKLIMCVVGVVGSLLVYGVLQVRKSRTTHNRLFSSTSSVPPPFERSILLA